MAGRAGGGCGGSRGSSGIGEWVGGQASEGAATAWLRAATVGLPRRAAVGVHAGRRGDWGWGRVWRRCSVGGGAEAGGMLRVAILGAVEVLGGGRRAAGGGAPAVGPVGVFFGGGQRGGGGG